MIILNIKVSHHHVTLLSNSSFFSLDFQLEIIETSWQFIDKHTQNNNLKEMLLKFNDFVFRALFLIISSVRKYII